MAKQPHLNGSYYGPSIPPPDNYHRHGRRGGGSGGCGGCCCCGCLCSCIFNLIFQIILTVVVIIGVAALIVWLVLRPNKVKFHVEDASLTQFDLSNNTLRYNLALNITVRNPNKRLGIYYDAIEARAIYKRERFNSVQLTPFYQGHKQTDYLNPAFKGEHLVVLSGLDQADYYSEKGSGVFGIDVKLFLRVRFKAGLIKFPKFKPTIDCDLNVPLALNSSWVKFERTECHLDW